MVRSSQFHAGAEAMRAFVAIDLPEQVCTELEVLQSSLSIGRTVSAENFHITLSFLGEQPDDMIEEAHGALSAIHAPAFDLHLEGVGSFGRRTPKVIFADVPRCGPLVELERRVTRRLRRVGLEFQKRRFRPHVTIARLPKNPSPFDMERLRGELAANAAFQSSRFDVTCFHLYQSVLTANGPVHDSIARYDLAKDDKDGS
jgi:2'-5' RNA ligase